MWKQKTSDASVSGSTVLREFACCGLLSLGEEFLEKPAMYWTMRSQLMVIVRYSASPTLETG